jgi:uncharacterized membrane protein
MFSTQLRRARLTYAIVMATCTCFIMSAVSTGVLAPTSEFWQHWPHVLLIDLCVAIPVAIALGPFVRRLCSRLYPDISK